MICDNISGIALLAESADALGSNLSSSESRFKSGVGHQTCPSDEKEAILRSDRRFCGFDSRLGHQIIRRSAWADTATAVIGWNVVESRRHRAEAPILGFESLQPA